MAERVVLSERQVRTWVARYNAGGPDALTDRPGRGRKALLTADQEDRPRGRRRAGRRSLPLRGEDVRRILAAEFGVVRCLQAVYDLLHRLGFEPLRPRPRHPQADPAAADRFKKASPERVAGAAAARPGGRVGVWFEDEARFGQKGTLTTVWADRGSRPTAPKQTAYAHLHVLTAVCPATGRAEGLVAPRLNGGVVQSFLDGVSATIPAGTRVVLVWDGAGYHSACKAVRPPANLTLVTLPPYSPELNPVERLWLYVRHHHWSNRVYPDIGAVEDAAGWRAVCLTPDQVKTICRCDYLPGS